MPNGTFADLDVHLPHFMPVLHWMTSIEKERRYLHIGCHVGLEVIVYDLKNLFGCLKETFDNTLIRRFALFPRATRLGITIMKDVPSFYLPRFYLTLAQNT